VLTERPFLAQTHPIAFAHRGGADVAPENTMPAFEAAVNLGYRYLETDVHVTADGALVAFHDKSLDRVTDQQGHIERLSLATIREADAGFWFSPDGGRTRPFRGRGVTVPTLEELLTRWPDVRVNIDPKNDLCIGPLASLLQRLDAFDRVCIGTFSDRRMFRLRALLHRRVCTSMPRNAVLTAWLGSRTGHMPRLDADCVQVPVRFGPVRIVDARFVAAAHRAHLPVHVWTVNEEEAVTELLDLGVDGIMTDRPALLRSALLSRGMWTAA
jgi:glycerophosphoryl diester phosphodiesterase